MKINPNLIRKKVLDMVYKSKSGHIGGSFSIAELIAVLYSNYDIGGKDKLILSKGHAVPAIYAALNIQGKISDQELETFREIDSRLQGHPDKVRLPFVDATTGSLGQGLSIAIGHALAKKLKNEDGKVFCILGDGEMQEGQIWEALMYAGRMDLGNLICFLDYNKAQNDGELIDFCYDTIADKIELFGWDCRIMYGHKAYNIEKELNMWGMDSGTPVFFVLETIKAKGVSFMEGNADWHCKCPNEQEYEKAIEELS